MSEFSQCITVIQILNNIINTELYLFNSVFYNYNKKRPAAEYSKHKKYFSLIGTGRVV